MDFNNKLQPKPASSGILQPQDQKQEQELKTILENATAMYGEKKAKQMIQETEKLIAEFGVQGWDDSIDFLMARIFDPKGTKPPKVEEDITDWLTWEGKEEDPKKKKPTITMLKRK